MNDTTMNTGAASLLPCPMCGAAPKLIVGYSPLNHAFVDCDCGMQTALKDTGEEVTATWNRRSPTPQADAAPIINGHAINDLFLKWSEWTTELGEAISRKNIDGFVSELRAAIAAGGAQEPVTDQQIYDKFGFLEGLVNESTYRRIAETAITIYNSAPLPRVAETVALTDAARDVLAERQRQVTAEGWTPEHDDEHTESEMALAAACYAMAAGGYAKGQTPPIWPWSLSWWKPAYGRRDLIKAGALILAEIERLDRAATSNGEQA
ncbi:Lar family restriction alleviation protein [Paraburkholderia strydomiana]|uniref:Lar family restriction alleviation protein n=1 Tax=Paraburkholderia strydomiana TaxID=1245417 RepID=A0ABW9C4A6_9BURK